MQSNQVPHFHDHSKNKLLLTSFLHVLYYNFGSWGANFSDSVGLSIVTESTSVGNSLNHGCGDN